MTLYPAPAISAHSLAWAVSASHGAELQSAMLLLASSWGPQLRSFVPSC